VQILTDAECDDALARIRRRHENRDDPRWSEAEADSEQAPYTVLSYLRRRHASLPRGLAADDLADALTVSGWTHYQQLKHERDLLRLVRTYGHSFGDLAAYLGLRSRQGAQDHLDALNALLAEYTRINGERRGPATGDGKTSALTRLPRASRKTRGADAHATRTQRRRVRLKLARTDWITTNHALLTDAITELLEQAAWLDLVPYASDEPAPEQADEETENGGGTRQPTPRRHSGEGSTEHETTTAEVDLGDYLHWLAQDLAADEPDPATLANLGLALGELRTHKTVTAQEPHHGIHKAIRHADRLRAGFNAIGTSRPTAKAEN
jgi:hypothetical protein